MEFRGLYTTNEKIEAEKALPEKDQTEKGKTIISNDAFAVGSVVEQLQVGILGMMRSLIK